MIQWVKKHWAFSVAALLVFAIAVVSFVFWNLYGQEEENMVPIYVTVKGLPEGKNMENRELMVSEDASISEIFSYRNEKVYEDFLQPSVVNNSFRKLMDVAPANGKRFYVKIDGQLAHDLTIAYIRYGAVVEIEYR